MIQYKLAKKFKIGAPLLSRVLSGKSRNVKAVTAVKLARLFDLPVDELVKIIISGKSDKLRKRLDDVYGETKC
jgi:hypothetical protein